MGVSIAKPRVVLLAGAKASTIGDFFAADTPAKGHAVRLCAWPCGTKRWRWCRSDAGLRVCPILQDIGLYSVALAIHLNDAEGPWNYVSLALGIRLPHAVAAARGRCRTTISRFKNRGSHRLAAVPCYRSVSSWRAAFAKDAGFWPVTTLPSVTTKDAQSSPFR